MRLSAVEQGGEQASEMTIHLLEGGIGSCRLVVAEDHCAMRMMMSLSGTLSHANLLRNPRPRQ